MQHAVKQTLATIVATLGPASDSPEMVLRLIEAGVAVFRLNFSHGTAEEHARRLATVRAAARQAGLPIGVLGDLPGPKIRTSKSPEGGLELAAGQEVVIDPALTMARVEGGRVFLGCTYATIGSEVSAGQRVLINDGAIRMLAVGDEAGGTVGGGRGEGGRALRCVVTTGGVVTSSKGINLPDTDLSVPAMTERDWAWVEWAVAHDVDFLALSFVRTAAEIVELKTRLAGMAAAGSGGRGGDVGGAIPVIAKIEKPQAVANIEAIAEAADGLMAARGDLGVEMDLAQVPMVQKKLVTTADAYGKPCIVATQMLESMITAAAPTRAEASDVANAVLDGADAVMLSAETAVGKHPALVVETMRRIIEAAEARVAETAHEASPPRKVMETRYRTAAVALGAWHVARGVGAKVVVCWSQNGGTARYLSQTGFRVPVVAYSSSERETRRMALLKGVRALLAEPASLAEWNRRVDEDLVRFGWAKPGETVILVVGRPLGTTRRTNTIAVHEVGNPLTGFFEG